MQTVSARVIATRAIATRAPGRYHWTGGAQEGMRKPGRVLGYVFLGLGGASILVGALPFFYVVVEAFLVGGIFLALGLWALAGPDLRATVRHAARAAAAAKRSQRKAGRPAPAIDPLLPVRILKLAKEKGGILTVAEVAVGLTVPLGHAEAGLTECVRAGNAMPDYDISRGHMLYRFPEFIAPSERTLAPDQ